MLRCKRVVAFLLAMFLPILLCACSNTACNDNIESGPFGQLYDKESGIKILDLGELIVLENCDITTTEYTLPNTFKNGLNINYVGDHSFNQNDTIVNLTIPDTYESIGQFSFSKCPNLESVYLGKNVKVIYDLAFTECPKLQSFAVSPENLYLYESDGCVIERETQRLIATNGKIPDGTKIIGACVFGGNKNLSNVIIPDGVEKIEGYAFDRSSVKTVILPETLSSIGELAFANCLELTEIFIPAGVNVIEEGILGGTDGVVINCEAEFQPEGWDAKWLDGCTNYQLNWGVERE